MREPAIDPQFHVIHGIAEPALFQVVFSCLEADVSRKDKVRLSLDAKKQLAAVAESLELKVASK